MSLHLLRVMSRGINGIGSSHISWENLADKGGGNVEKIKHGLNYYLPGMLYTSSRSTKSPAVAISDFKAWLTRATQA